MERFADGKRFELRELEVGSEFEKIEEESFERGISEMASFLNKLVT